MYKSWEGLYGKEINESVKKSAVLWQVSLLTAKKIYIERRPSFFAFAGIGTKMKKMLGICR